MSVALTSEQKDTIRDETNTAKRINLMFNSLVSNIDAKCSSFYVQDDEPNAPAGVWWYKPSDKELRFKAGDNWFLVDGSTEEEW